METNYDPTAGPLGLRLKCAKWFAKDVAKRLEGCNLLIFSASSHEEWEQGITGNSQNPKYMALTAYRDCEKRMAYAKVNVSFRMIDGDNDLAVNHVSNELLHTLDELGKEKQ